MSRSDCVDWWAARYDRPPERSACVACPFQPRQRWVETKRRWPKLFAEAVDIDARMRGGLALDKTPYLHSLQMPLPEAVALDGADMGPDGQTDAFGNEWRGDIVACSGWEMTGLCGSVSSSTITATYGLPTR